MKRIIPSSATENNYFAAIEDDEKRKIEKRVLAYITKSIRNSKNGYCFISQAVIRKALKVRKQRITDACRAIVERGELIRIPVNNKNRKNPQYYYFLPNAELLGNSIKSSFISKKGQEKKEDEFLSNSVLPNQVKIEEVRIDFEPNFLEVGSWNNLDRLNLIEKYLEAGLMVTPLIEGGKKPPKGWTKLKLRNKTKNELLNYFVQNPQANVGCWMPENFVVVDADDLDEFYRLTGGEVWETLTATSGREEGGLHYWFRHSGNVGSGTGIRPDLDFKSSRSLVVLPPSVHKSGAEYRWQNLVAPIDAPELIQDFYDTRQNLKKQNLKSLPVLPIARRGASVFINADTVLGEKQRYDHLFPIGRRLRFRLNAEEVIAELHRLNGLHCQPPLNEERMRKLVKDVLHGRDRRDFRRN